MSTLLLYYLLGIGLYKMSAYKMLYAYYGNKYEVDPKLLEAIAKTESSENPVAVSSVGAFGLMQIYPQGNFQNIEGWPVSDATDLFNPGLSVKLGAQILAWNIKHYGLLRGVAVYNNWGARNDPASGPFRNQDYVNRVMGFYRDI